MKNLLTFGLGYLFGGTSIGKAILGFFGFIGWVLIFGILYLIASSNGWI